MNAPQHQSTGPDLRLLAAKRETTTRERLERHEAAVARIEHEVAEHEERLALHDKAGRDTITAADVKDHEAERLEILADLTASQNRLRVAERAREAFLDEVHHSAEERAAEQRREAHTAYRRATLAHARAHADLGALEREIRDLRRECGGDPAPNRYMVEATAERVRTDAREHGIERDDDTLRGMLGIG